MKVISTQHTHTLALALSSRARTRKHPTLDNDTNMVLHEIIAVQRRENHVYASWGGQREREKDASPPPTDCDWKNKTQFGRARKKKGGKSCTFCADAMRVTSGQAKAPSTYERLLKRPGVSVARYGVL